MILFDYMLLINILLMKQLHYFIACINYGMEAFGWGNMMVYG